jgi:hypothetical protein
MHVFVWTIGDIIGLALFALFGFVILVLVAWDKIDNCVRRRNRMKR